MEYIGNCLNFLVPFRMVPKDCNKCLWWSSVASLKTYIYSEATRNKLSSVLQVILSRYLSWSIKTALGEKSSTHTKQGGRDSSYPYYTSSCSVSTAIHRLCIEGMYSGHPNNHRCFTLTFLWMELLYVEQLAHECNCIHDLYYQLYSVPPLQLLACVKYCNHVPLPNKEY